MPRAKKCVLTITNCGYTGPSPNDRTSLDGGIYIWPNSAVGKLCHETLPWYEGGFAHRSKAGNPKKWCVHTAYHIPHDGTLSSPFTSVAIAVQTDYDGNTFMQLHEWTAVIDELAELIVAPLSDPIHFRGEELRVEQN